MNTAKKVILVVDDNADMVSIVKSLLESKGHNVMCAYSGQETFNLLERKKPDLIFLDVMMPKMSGLEVLHRLKNNPATRSIPVVMLTVKSQHKDILEGYKHGADYYLTKPFTISQITSGVDLLLEESCTC